MRAAPAVLAACAALALAAVPTATADAGEPRHRGLLSAPKAHAQRSNEATVVRRFLAEPKVRDWLGRYDRDPSTSADFERDKGTWRVHVWAGEAGEVATGRVDDRTLRVTEAWTGPQVAWKMARGYRGAFGGTEINRPAVWLPLCAVFLLGLVDWRRLRSMRTLDVAVPLALSGSLWAFNAGHVFAAMLLAAPVLAWLGARLAWVGARGATPGRGVWPTWLLLAAVVFLAGFRVGLNVEASNVIDVGFSGVVGGDRILRGQAPWGNFPTNAGTPCGPADTEGEIRDHVQGNGRCETSNERGDTYGPTAYLAYVPAVAALGWDGKWSGSVGIRHMPAAHATTIAFDLLCLLGLALVGLRFGGARGAATLAFAWAAYPFTLYAASANTNDGILAALVIWSFWAASVPALRGALLALAAWTKFAPLLLVPLWLRSCGARRAPAVLAGALGATAASFAVLLLEPSPLHAARVLAERTVGWQVGRDSPFSLWGWGQYHAAGLPDLAAAQTVLQVLLVVAALALAVVPFRLGPRRLAALGAALLVGFELVLTHWSYLYVPWFFGLAAVALYAPGERAAPRREEVADAREPAVAAVV